MNLEKITITLLLRDSTMAFVP